jgi:hypothetical protein
VSIRFHSMRKGFGVRDMIGTAQNAFGQTGLNITNSGDGFLIGGDGAATVLCHAMAISDTECHVIVVATAENDQATQVTERVAAILKGASHL